MLAADTPRPAAGFTPAKTALFAGQCGLIAMGSYYAQPYELNIATYLRFDPHLTGFVVTSSQLGYVAGLLLIAPLGNLLEYRRVVVSVMTGSLIALLCAGLAPSAPAFMVACFGIGLPELRRRGLMQAFLFGAFSLFWTAVPLKLETFHLGRMQLASFGLIGGLGLLIAPMAGRAADQRRGRLAGWIGIVLTATAFITSTLFNSPWALVFCAVLIGAGVQGNLVVSQYVIPSLDQRAGHRLDGLFVACFFVGSAAGSAVAAPIMAFGWIANVSAGCAVGAAIQASHLRPASTRRP
ncbi:MFS family permease [Bradyrhizobium japonicum]